MSEIACQNCRRPYPQDSIPYRCPQCGGVFDTGVFHFNPELIDPDRPGMWRYWQALGLPPDAPVVTLGEGSTPLVWGHAPGRQVGYKLEFLNPTGSYKDRGSAPLLSFLKTRGVSSAIEDSSGNAGASFAAYAGRAGVQARVFIPDSTSGPKRAQIEAYGAEIVRVLGPRSKTAEVVRKAADEGAVYASHAYLPFGLAGYATIAYELCEQLGGAPRAVVAPVGQGNLLLAVGRGFMALKNAGVIERIPRLVGVQARACAPLWAVFEYGAAGMGWVTEGQTLAEGVRVKHPLRGDALLQLIQFSGGVLIAVDEEQILPGRDQLARQGLYVEPTSAIVWNALEQVQKDLPDPTAVILTGSGLKFMA